MKWIVSSEEMRRADETTSSYFGLDSLILMERAALFVAEAITKRFPKNAKILIMAGNGGNGGDGVAIGRLLSLQGYPVTICLLKKKEECNASCRKQIEIAEKYECEFADFETIREKTNQDASFYDVVVDALLGNGVNRDCGGILKERIERINSLKSYVYAVDLPSGLNADYGNVQGACIKADETITFAFLKRGLTLFPGRELARKVTVADIGITKESFMGCYPYNQYIEASDLKHLFIRPKQGNKGTFGKILILAGSKGMAGAAIFSARSAFRMGAGMVKIFTHESNREILQTSLPEAMLTLYDEETTKEVLSEKLCSDLDWADVCVAGPGLSTSFLAKQLMLCFKELLPKFPNIDLILDADAINILSKDMTLCQAFEARESHPVIFTPHLMEFSRLSGIAMPELKQSLYENCMSYAKDKNAIYIVKDATSLVIQKERAMINLSGCSALSTAGSGDCLTGILAGLLAQKKLQTEPADALTFLAKAVWLHGYLGEYVEKQEAGVGAIASDFIQAIPKVLEELEVFDS